MTATYRYTRAVRFEEVDAAGIVFFAVLVGYAHEAMERFFDAVPGGYVDLIMRQRIGFPAVKLESEFSAPLRYGDSVDIDTTVAHIGTRSATFRYRFLRVSDAVACAEIRHTVVLTALDAMASCDMPDAVRSLLERYHESRTTGDA